MPHPHPEVIVCSFYTDDDYYRGWATKLKANLDRLGVAHELREFHKSPGQDWADICRKKVAFLDEVCTANPHSRVYWIDVDCELLSFPEELRSFTADIIGFQHGFSAPMQIGYAARSRFWAPSFLGINATPAARKFVSDAAALEASSPLKATDDYFFEESWRANADLLSFQILPSGAILGRGDERVPAFFKFGSSGNVPDFVNKVVQHTSPNLPGLQSAAPRRNGRAAVKRRVLRTLKSGERLAARLDHERTARVREWAKAHPLLGRLKPTAPADADPTRARLASRALTAGQSGRSADVAAIREQLSQSGVVTAKESSTLQAADAFAEYAERDDAALPPLPLVWWPRPFPGNFGDWLSPLIFSDASGRAVRFVPATGTARAPHIVGIGSVARFTNSHSIVAGTGASAEDAEMAPSAAYHSLRGPLTAKILRELGGPDVESFGDPGLLLRRTLPQHIGETNGRLLLVRHFTHRQFPVHLPEDMDEASVYAAGRTEISELVARLAGYDGVVTSAMHIAIACHSYGIPVALIRFEGFEHTVSGSGMKYRDYSLGAELSAVWEPEIVPLDLRTVSWRSRLGREYVSEAKLDEIAVALEGAISRFTHLDH